MAETEQAVETPQTETPSQPSGWTGHTGSVDEAQSAIEKLFSNGYKSVNEEEDDPKLVSVHTESAPETPAVAASGAQTGEEAKAPAQSPAIETKEAPKALPSDYEAKLQEATRKAQEADTVRTHLINQLNTLVPALQQRVAGEFPDIKSIDDLERLADTDPARYNRYILSQARIQQAQQAQNQAVQQQQVQQRQQFESWQQTELRKLPDLIPEMADPEKAPQIAREVLDFAKSQGVTDEQLINMPAHGFKIMHRAMMADKYEASQKAQAAELAQAKQIAEQKAKGAPRVQTPGAIRPDATKGDRLQEDARRHFQQQNVDSAAAIFRHMLQ